MAIGFLGWGVEKENLSFGSTPAFSKKEEQLYPGLELVSLTTLKAPLAVWLWIEAFTAWENHEWDRMALLMKRALFFEPRHPLYYEMAAWYLAWNTNTGAYLQEARTILEEGICNNPESALLYEQLGLLLRDKLHDHLAASRAFATAATLPGAHSYLCRFAAYELAACPEYEAEAYQQLQQLYAEGPAERFPALLAKMKFLERRMINRDERK